MIASAGRGTCVRPVLGRGPAGPIELPPTIDEFDNAAARRERPSHAAQS
jgi:hypothetical protein